MTAAGWRNLTGATAVVAPILHTVSDVMELGHGGFTQAQLWLNLLAFVAMPFLLWGICVVVRPKPGAAAFVGAALYGMAFAYFTYTTIYALIYDIPTYEELWVDLGIVYTLVGALMVAGGVVFGYSLLRSGALPRPAVLTFLLGIGVNFALALTDTPDVMQTAGTALRNLGLVAMGASILFPAGAFGPRFGEHR